MDETGFFIASATIRSTERTIAALRGRFGAALYRHSLYSSFFAPVVDSGPSGFHNSPRAFVLRIVSERSAVIHIFDPSIDFAKLRELTGSADPPIVLGNFEKVYLPLVSNECEQYLRIAYRTPTEIKHAGAVILQPEFPIVIGRLLERIWRLGQTYQRWSDIPGFVELRSLSKQVRLCKWEWKRSEQFRRSSSNGNVHSIGGYTGWGEYEGPLGPFLPILRIGAWVGVGRQTVWGNGHIEMESARLS